MSKEDNLLKRRLAQEVEQIRLGITKESGGEVLVLEMLEDPVALSVAMNGPNGSRYKGETFVLLITVPPDYPFKPPKVVFQTAISHPNVDAESGHMDSFLWQLRLGCDTWSPVVTIERVLRCIWSLLKHPILDDGFIVNPHADAGATPGLDIDAMFEEPFERMHQGMISQFVEMGFDREIATSVLESCDFDEDLALSRLLSLSGGWPDSNNWNDEYSAGEISPERSSSSSRRGEIQDDSGSVKEESFKRRVRKTKARIKTTDRKNLKPPLIPKPRESTPRPAYAAAKERQRIISRLTNMGFDRTLAISVLKSCNFEEDVALSKLLALQEECTSWASWNSDLLVTGDQRNCVDGEAAQTRLQKLENVALAEIKEGLKAIHIDADKAGAISSTDGNVQGTTSSPVQAEANDGLAKAKEQDEEESESANDASHKTDGNEPKERDSVDASDCIETRQEEFDSWVDLNSEKSESSTSCRYPTE